METKLLKDEDIVVITNRNFSTTCYYIPELNRERDFGPNMTKKIAMGELRALVQAPGGFNLLRDYFIIHDKNALEELIGDVEPEYHYQEKDVDYLLVKGSLAQVQDALDWAPDGVVELMKARAVQISLPDRDKTKAIFDATGFDVDAAIRNMAAYEDEDDKPVAKKRRSTAIQAQSVEEEKPKRQSAPLEVSKEIPEVTEEEDETPVVQNKYSIG